MSDGSAVLHVRSANAADTALLAHLGARTFMNAYATRNDPRNIERYVAEAFSETQVAAEIAMPGSRFLLAYDETAPHGSPAGYARLQDGWCDCVDGLRPIELVRIYIEPSAIGHGYGSALLRACLDRASHDGHDTIWLGVWEHNDGAQRFYEREGFLRVGEQHFVLGDDVQHDHIMARQLHQRP